MWFYSVFRLVLELQRDIQPGENFPDICENDKREICEMGAVLERSRD